MNTVRIVAWTLVVALLAASAAWLGLLIPAGRDLRAYDDGACAALQLNRRLAAKSIGLREQSEVTAANAKTSTFAKQADAKATAPAAASSASFGQQVSIALSHMPEYAPLRRAEVHRWVMREYGEWLSQLKVTPERLAMVKEVMTDFRLASQDAYDAMTNAGYRQGTKEFDALYTRYLAENEELLRQKLLPDELASYRDFAKARSWTSRVPDLIAYLEERGVPALSAEQKHALTAAYLAAGDAKAEGASAAALQYRMTHDRMAQLIEPALDPAQCEAVRGYLKYLNDRSRVLGRLLHPNAPDAYIITPGTSSR